jgi:hypothetical protein
MYSRNAYFNRQAQCILPKLVMYGLNQPSGYYESEYDQANDPTIIHVQRLFQFLPSDDIKAAVIQKYIFDGEEKFKARRLGITRHAYRGLIEKAVSFFVENRNVKFS